MKSTIKKLLILLFLITPMTTTSSFSTILKTIEKDSLVTITPTQLKETNLIFAEHNKLLVENKLLIEQIQNYKEENGLLVKADSIKDIQINNYKSTIKDKGKSLLYWKIGGITVSTSLVLLLLLK